MATLITGDVIALSTITPDRFVPGLDWDSAGNVTASRFVGDGLQMTGLAPGLSSLTVTDALFSLTPAHNNAVIYFNNSGGTSVDIPFDPEFQDGHKTTIIQQGAGQVLLTPPNVYSQSGFNRTRTQYSVAELEYLKNSDDWNLYGDLGVGATYALNASTATVNEAASVTITLNTTLVSNGTLVPYTVAGTITNADLSGSSAGLTGNFSINNNTGSITFFLTGDGITEGQELINLALNNNEASISVPVIDTSNNSSYSLTRSVSSANEGASVIITLTAPAVPNGTNVPYTVTGINGADLSSGSLTGNFTINSGTATQTFTFSNDQLTESNETMVLALNNGTASISVLVLDTSKNPAPQFTQISAGYRHSLALSGTDLYATGANQDGALGITPVANAYIFTKVTVPASAKWTVIAAGHQHYLALSGTDLYATGYNFNGNLGLGDRNLRSIFTKVTIPANAKWTAIAAGVTHSLALSGTDLYGTGSGYGLGLGDINNRSTFTKIPGSWTSIATGSEYSLALSGSDLYVTGDNGLGKLGLGDLVDRRTFTKVSGNWTAIAAGRLHSLALSGTDLYGTGDNQFGGLGLGVRTHRSVFTKVTVPTNAKWTAIAAGWEHSLALSGTDSYTTGSNNNGQLGLGDTAHRSTFTKVTGNWSTIAAGHQHSLALSGTHLYSGGEGGGGQLGLGDQQNRTIFAQVTAVG